MGALYRVGEKKIRPGVYRRYENAGSGSVPGALVGVMAIAVHADFGPLGVVTEFEKDEVSDMTALYGTGGTMDAAKALFDGGCSTVLVYRLGSGGTASSLEVKNASDEVLATLTMKYPTDSNYNVSIKTKLDDNTKKQILVYLDTTLLETIDFAVSTDESEAFVAAVNENSSYLIATAGSGTGEVAPIANVALTDGVAPTVTNESYEAAFAEFEAYTWNYLVLDTVDTAVHALASAYMDRIYESGLLGVCILGEPTTVSFADRLAHAKAFNDEKIIYLGSGFVDADGNNVDGYLAVAKQAGIIGATGSEESVTHTVVTGAVNTIEKLKNSQYEDAIKNGMLLLSPNAEGQVWFDSGINTLITLGEEQDEGWKKIRRTSTRFEVFDRIDRAVAPLIGKVNCDNIGVGDVIMAAQKVLDAMVSEAKFLSGAVIAEDTEFKRGSDYAFFVIDATDIDSLEKIYLRYRFRFSAE